METDNKNGTFMPIGFNILNLSTLVNTIVYDYIRNNHNGGSTVVGNHYKKDNPQS